MFDIMVTCEDCGEQFVLPYGDPLVCPKCGSEICTDQFEDWLWWD